MDGRKQGKHSEKLSKLPGDIEGAELVVRSPASSTESTKNHDELVVKRNCSCVIYEGKMESCSGDHVYQNSTVWDTETN